jgi:hypothetical protein
MGPLVLVAVVVLGPVGGDADPASIAAFIVLVLLCAVGWWLWRSR